MAEKKNSAAISASAVAAATLIATQIPSKTGGVQLTKLQQTNRALDLLSIAKNKSFDDVIVGPQDVKTATKLADKIQFSKSFPNTIKTLDLKSVVGKNATKAQALKSIEAAVGKDFVIKASNTALTDTKDLITKSNFSRKFTSVVKNRTSLLLQPKINIQEEFRVTTAAGRVTSVTKRRLSKTSTSGLGAVIPVFGKKRDELRKFVERSFRTSTVTPTRTGVVGFDVARTPKGFKLVEANIFPAGLLNPIKNLRAKHALLGRVPIKAALGIALASGVAAFLVSRMSKRQHCKNPSFITRGGVVVPICPKSGSKKKK